MRPQEQADRLIERLHEKAKGSPLGVQGTTTAVGRHRTFFDERKRAGNIRLSKIFEILEAIEVAPGDFFEELFASDGDPINGRLSKDVAAEDVELDDAIVALARRAGEDG